MEPETLQPFFYGRSEHRINAKGQVSLPARFRSLLTEDDTRQGLVLIQGEAQCIYIYTHRQFRSIVERVRKDPATRDDAAFLRDFFESAYGVDLDAQGRIVIPAEIRASAGITETDVVFIGHDDRIEVWDRASRHAEQERTSATFSEKRATQARRIFGP